MALFLIDFDSIDQQLKKEQVKISWWQPKKGQKAREKWLRRWKEAISGLVEKGHEVGITTRQSADSAQTFLEDLQLDKDIQGHVSCLATKQAEIPQGYYIGQIQQVGEMAALADLISLISDPKQSLQGCLQTIRTFCKKYAINQKRKDQLIQLAVAHLKERLNDPDQPLDQCLKTVKIFCKDDAISELTKDQLLQLALGKIAKEIKKIQQELKEKIKTFGIEVVNQVYSTEEIDEMWTTLSTFHNEYEQAANKQVVLGDEKKAHRLIDHILQYPSVLDQAKLRIAKKVDHLVSNPHHGTWPKVKDKIAFREQWDFPTIADMNHFVKISEKVGGAHSAGRYGGIYVYPYIDEETGEKKLQRVLFKKEKERKNSILNYNSSMAELVAARLMNAVIGNDAAPTFLATQPASPNKKISLPDETGEHIYVGSIYYDQSQDLYKKIGFNRRLHMMGSWNKDRFNEGFFMEKKTKEREEYAECRFENLERVMVGGALTGDFDLHPGNIMVIPSQDKSKEGKLVKVDHGSALKDLEDDVHIHSHTRHLPGIEPTNHIREFPRHLKVNEAFAKELERQADVDLKKSIHTVIDELGAYYGRQPLFEFAQYIGMSSLLLDRDALIPDMGKSPPLLDRDALLHAMKVFLTTKMVARQQSLRQLAIEIRLSLCIKKVEKEGKSQFELTNDEEINSLIRKHPLYFLKEKYHFRSRDQRSVFGPLKTKRFKQHALTALVRKKVYENINILVEQSIKEKDPRVIEHIFANKRLCQKLKREQFLYDAQSKKEAPPLYTVMIDGYKKMLERKLGALLSKTEEEIKREVINAILQERSLPQRAFVVARWMRLMQVATQDEERFDHVITAISEALQEPAIARLHDTFAAIPPLYRPIRPLRISKKGQPSRSMDDFMTQDQQRSDAAEPETKYRSPWALNKIRKMIMDLQMRYAPTAEGALTLFQQKQETAEPAVPPRPRGKTI
jgi:hypothetical protein